MFDAGAAPEHPEWVPVSDWQQDRVWLRGLDLFDQRFYWECHESFEAMWHALERGSLLHRLTQGLIQSAASVLKRHMGHEKSADYLMVRATEKLLSVAEESASFCRGVELLDFVAQMERFKEGGEWPQIGREV
jgi:predicted metal-dependent hydrolase